MQDDKEQKSRYADARAAKKTLADEDQFWKRITTAGTFAVVSAVAVAVELFLKKLLKK